MFFQYSIFLAFLSITACWAAGSDTKNTTRKHGPIDCAALKSASAASVDVSDSSWMPECNSTTNQLLPVQTMRNGQKFCVDLWTTGVLLGPTSSPTLVCQCAQAHKRARLRKQGYQPQCNPSNGQYSAQQCDTVERKECWCVDPTTGVETAGSKWAVKPESAQDSGKCGAKA
ncbi:uncharacterized protein LOC129583082 [Paramacrobiotus metropolitanus]|uniref:uncharacterized protein LOC129583082 n=1 Tax=Paramacrobiotus metropolitanus TaxID=2943436 RepID=UPI0024456D7A|nr:uncharacterized protein LOC129583082 [Paramacrobiotus metropolitanus]